MKVAMARFHLVLLLSLAGCTGPEGATGTDTGSTATAVDVTGRWNVSIVVGTETITGLAMFTQTGDRLSGSMGPNEDNQHPLEGIVDGGRIMLTMRPGPGRSTAFDTSSLIVDGERLKGTTAGGRADQGVIELVRDNDPAFGL